MTLQVTLLLENEFLVQRWTSARQLEALLTELSAETDPRGLPHRARGLGSPLEPTWSLFDHVGADLSDRDLNAAIAGCDIAFVQKHLRKFRILPLGRWGAFVELPESLSRLCTSLAKCIRGRGAPSGSFGVWMSYLPGSRRPADMRLMHHPTPNDLITAVGEPNVVHLVSLSSPRDGTT